MQFKRRIILLYVFLAYTLVCLGIHIGYAIFDNYLSIIIGVLIMIFAIPLHIIGKKYPWLYFMTFLINTFGVGLTIASYYEFRLMIPSVYDFIKVLTITFVLISFFGAITFPKRIKPYVKLFAVVVILVLFITSIVLWILNDELIYSLFFYFLNITYFFMVGMITANHHLEDLSKEMSLVSFGSFIFVSVIILIIISKGEALEGIGETFIEGIGESLAEVIPKRKKVK